MDVEQRARELVMAELPNLTDENFDCQGITVVNLQVVMRLLRAALTPPEGYAEMARDAQRYRYIRSIAAGEPHEFGWIEEAAFVASNGDPNQFDFNIDEQMSARPEVKP